MSGGFMPYEVSKSDDCPKSKPWAVINKSTGEVKGCSETEEAAQSHMRALYVHEGDERSAGQWQALYGSTGELGRWAVVIGPWGFAPERDYAGLTYLGEPIDLLRQLYRYRLSLAREGAALDYIAGVLASELHISRSELDALITAGERVNLPSAGWMGLSQACLFGIGTETWQSAR